MDAIYRIPKRSATPAPKPVAEIEEEPVPVIGPMVTSRKIRLRRPNSRALVRVFVWSLIVTGAYLVAAPYSPSIWFYLHPPKPLASVTKLQNITPTGTKEAPSYAYYGKNILTIGKIGVQSEILEGVDENTLDNGLWRRPNTSTPALGGNTVIAAHRYKYITGANTFYNLDKLQVGDTISLVWQGKQYTYQVFSTEVVPASETSVEANTAEPQLTLYTCTPLWKSTDRLVVRAKPV